MELIKKDEDETLFRLQNQILMQMGTTPTELNIIQLALLQTLSPICDYLAAINVLRGASTNEYSFKINIIGAYLSAIWDYDSDNTFLGELKKNMELLGPAEASMVWYVEAEQLHHRYLDPMESLEKSIACYDGHVKNYLLALQKALPEIRISYRLKAKRNIKTVLTEAQIRRMDKWYFINADSFINEFITGTTMNEFAYRELFGV